MRIDRSAAVKAVEDLHELVVQMCDVLGEIENDSFKPPEAMVIFTREYQVKVARALDQLVSVLELRPVPTNALDERARILKILDRARAQIVE